ncbi:proline-rich protein 2-like [Moschus berezovskii]|uniref:proline-rich protein 2-like n=1 Tax=Moschus berezovskii TaxID=68408 RepID=UPI0024448BE9|nr:proline-rich protein 2-like [Moschus berezovskii]
MPDHMLEDQQLWQAGSDKEEESTAPPALQPSIAGFPAQYYGRSPDALSPRRPAGPRPSPPAAPAEAPGAAPAEAPGAAPAEVPPEPPPGPGLPAPLASRARQRASGHPRGRRLQGGPHRAPRSQPPRAA